MTRIRATYGMALIILASLSVLAYAQTTPLIYACVDPKGRPTIIAPGGTCGPKDRLITWPAEVPEKAVGVGYSVYDANGAVVGPVAGFDEDNSDPGTLGAIVPFDLDGILTVAVVYGQRIVGRGDDTQSAASFDTGGLLYSGPNCTGDLWVTRPQGATPVGIVSEITGFLYGADPNTVPQSVLVQSREIGRNCFAAGTTTPMMVVPALPVADLRVYTAPFSVR
jgi:hypothetical protein